MSLVNAAWHAPLIRKLLKIKMAFFALNSFFEQFGIGQGFQYLSDHEQLDDVDFVSVEVFQSTWIQGVN